MATSREDLERPIVLSEEQLQVFRLVLQGASIFLTGRAGTGKTTLLKEIIKTLYARFENEEAECVYVTSSTGISACYLGGTTVHSFGGIGLGEDPVGEILQKMYPNARQRWKQAKILVIDEISMLRPDTFDKLEEIARHVRRNGLPFGGIQLIACGDFYQLPPVYKGGAEVKYCFEATSWPQVITRSFELKTVFRQTDGVFLTILDDIRQGHISRETATVLRTRVNAEISKLKGTKLKPTLLRSRRETVLQENLTELGKLTTEGRKSTAIDKADSAAYLKLLQEGCQAPEVLLMRVGAQVLLIKNLDVSSGLCNGAAGIITEFVEECPRVEFATQTITITKTDWEIKVGKKIVASRHQFPLILGWSVTIHKSQGMSLDTASVELSHLFASGQGYTALSRVRSLEGLSIDCVPPSTSFATSEKVEAYYKTLH